MQIEYLILVVSVKTNNKILSEQTVIRFYTTYLRWINSEDDSDLSVDMCKSGSDRDNMNRSLWVFHELSDQSYFEVRSLRKTIIVLSIDVVELGTRKANFPFNLLPRISGSSSEMLVHSYVQNYTEVLPTAKLS